MNFDPEVFISYAHLDNRADWGGVEWVTEFYKSLDARIEEVRGEHVNTFFDPELQGNELLTPALLERLKRAGIFVAVLTPRYVKSEWTRRELSEFCASATETGGVHIAEKSRIFAVVKTEVPREKHPPELRDLITYEFFEVDPLTKVPLELETRSEKFKVKVNDIAHRMKTLLEEIEGIEKASAIKTGATKTIYLAETTVELQPQRDALWRDLEQQGHIVLPSRALPVVGADLESFVREQMARSDISIHMIGSTYSFVPEGSKQCVTELQNKIALERTAAGGFSHLIWIAPGLKIEDDRQKSFLEALRANPNFHSGTDLLESSLEDLKTEIHSRLERKKEPAASTVRTGTRQIYLIYDREDREAVLPWSDFLFDRGFEVLRPAFDGDDAEIRQLHEENLRSCDAVAIFYGAGKDAWIQATMRSLQRRRADENAGELRAVAILVAPPITLEKQHFRTRFFGDVIPQWEGLAPESLGEFLKLVNGS